MSNGRYQPATSTDTTQTTASCRGQEWLRDAVSTASAQVKVIDQFAQQSLSGGRLPLPWLRHTVRQVLGTDGTGPSPLQQSPLWHEVEYRTTAAARQMRDDLEGEGREVLLGFPAAPFALTMTAPQTRGIEQFLGFARDFPTHEVRLTRRKGTNRAASWEVTPQEISGAYRLSFNLPSTLDDWIANSELERSRVRMVEEDLLSTILIYRMSDRRTEVFRLQYSPFQADAARR
jgi:hypothetical protein